jgi:hypothetical protein
MIKLYDKKLTNLKELKQEIALKRVEADTSFDNLLSTNSTPKHATATGEQVDDGSIDWSAMIGTGLDFITSKGTVNKMMALAVPAMKLVGSKMEKDMLKSIGKEFITGYAKWKAIEFGFKLVSRMVRSKINKKDD